METVHLFLGPTERIQHRKHLSEERYVDRKSGPTDEEAIANTHYKAKGLSLVRLRFYGYCCYFIFSGQEEIFGTCAGMKGRTKPFSGNKYSEAQCFDYFMDRELYAHIAVIIFPHGTD